MVKSYGQILDPPSMHGARIKVHACMRATGSGMHGARIKDYEYTHET
jgi:hypothetical protein